VAILVQKLHQADEKLNIFDVHRSLPDTPERDTLHPMQRISAFLLALLCLATSPPAYAASKPHVIALGKWTVVKWSDADGRQTFDMKIRALFVDTRLKEYTTGVPHDVTDRLFVVRRVFRLNDALPGEAVARWQWQRGGWLLLDHMTGRISQLPLPDFDPFYSAASWYRDYIAYCGLSEDGKKLYAVVAQVGRRKPILKQALGEFSGSNVPDSACPAPSWDRTPARVTFRPEHGQSLSFSIRERVVDVLADSADDDQD
jgi:hypothetical protein